MKLLLRIILKAVVVMLSVVVGFVSGLLVVRVIPAHGISPGITEGTPVQIAGFVGGFAIAFLISLAVGVHWLERYWGRGLPPLPPRGEPRA